MTNNEQSGKMVLGKAAKKRAARKAHKRMDISELPQFTARIQTIPPELRRKIQYYLWDDAVRHFKCALNVPQLEGIPILDPKIVDRVFAEEAVNYRYTHLTHHIDTNNGGGRAAVEAYFASDPFGVGLAPREVEISALVLWLAIFPEAYDSLYKCFDFLQAAPIQTAKKGFKLVLWLSIEVYQFKLEDLHALVVALRPVVSHFKTKGDVVVKWMYQGDAEEVINVTEWMDKDIEHWKQGLEDFLPQMEALHRFYLAESLGVDTWLGDLPNDVLEEDDEESEVDEDEEE